MPPRPPGSSALHGVLGRFLLRRCKADVLRDLPPKAEFLVPTPPPQSGLCEGGEMQRAVGSDCVVLDCLNADRIPQGSPEVIEINHVAAKCR